MFYMALPQEKIYTEEDYYNLPKNVRAELIDGQFYNMSSFTTKTYSFHDTVKVGIYDDLSIDFSSLDIDV